MRSTAADAGRVPGAQRVIAVELAGIKGRHADHEQLKSTLWLTSLSLFFAS